MATGLGERKLNSNQNSSYSCPKHATWVVPLELKTGYKINLKSLKWTSIIKALSL